MRFKNTERKTISAGLSLPEEVIDKIDTMRGDVPRSRFALRLIELGFQQMAMEKVIA
jgi:hypothetical protein